MRRKNSNWLYLIYSLILSVAVCCSCGVQTGKVYISDTLTCRDISSDGEPIGVMSTYPAGTKRIYFLFDLEGPISAPLEIRWLYEDNLIGGQKGRMPPGVSQTWLEADEAFPAGLYRIEIVMMEVVIAETTFTVTQE